MVPEIKEETKAPKVREHKTFGKYEEVIVDWKQPHKNNLDIFVSINNYTATFKPDTAIELPKGIIQFLKEATYEEHYHDAKDNVHKTRPKRKYSIEKP